MKIILKYIRRTVDGETVHCVAISGEGRPSVFYAKGVAERRVWAQRILEATTPIFPTRYTTEFTRASWAYLKVYAWNFNFEQ